MPEKTGDEMPTKREIILMAARNLFAEKGYEETTIADIARGAGVAVGTVYLYFHNKHDVYTATSLNIELSIAQAFQNPLLRELPFKEVIRTMIDASFRISRQYQQFMSLLQTDMQSPEEIRQHKEIDDQVTRTIDALMRYAIEKSELAPFNTAMYAEILSCAAGAVIHQCFVVEGGEREKQYREYLIELIERLFFGPSLQEGS